MCNSNTRGHSLKFRKRFSLVNTCAFSFANRCVDVWNSLDFRLEYIVTEPSLYSFKAGLNFYRAMHFSAKRGITIACRLSVRPSVRLSVCDVGGS